MKKLSKISSLLSSCYSKKNFSCTANSKADLKSVLREVIPAK